MESFPGTSHTGFEHVSPAASGQGVLAGPSSWPRFWWRCTRLRRHPLGSVCGRFQTGCGRHCTFQGQPFSPWTASRYLRRGHETYLGKKRDQEERVDCWRLGESRIEHQRFSEKENIRSKTALAVTGRNPTICNCSYQQTMWRSWPADRRKVWCLYRRGQGIWHWVNLVRRKSLKGESVGVSRLLDHLPELTILPSWYVEADNWGYAYISWSRQPSSLVKGVLAGAVGALAQWWHGVFCSWCIFMVCPGREVSMSISDCYFECWSRFDLTRLTFLWSVSIGFHRWRCAFSKYQVLILSHSCKLQEHLGRNQDGVVGLRSW